MCSFATAFILDYFSLELHNTKAATKYVASASAVPTHTPLTATTTIQRAQVLFHF